MKLLFPSTFGSLAVRIAVALLIITSRIMKNVSATTTTSHDDASSQSSPSIKNEDNDLMNYDHGGENFTSIINKIMTHPDHRLLLEQFCDGSSTNTDDELVQLGDPIKGKAAKDYFGWSVATSKSGEFVIIGGSGNADSGAYAGIAQIYRYNKNTEKWEKVGGDILGEKAGDQSGFSVDINDAGDVVIIGSPYNDSATGHARVFRLIDGQWYKQGQDLIGTSNSYFGRAVAISSDGGKVIVSGPFYATGYVKVYEYNSDIQRWEQVGLTIVGAAAGDKFGWSADMDDSGNAIIVGAPNNDGNGGNSGHARVYRLIDRQWVQQGQDLKGKKAGNLFGLDVAMSDGGKTVIIGGPYHDVNGSYSGHAQVYLYKDDIQRWEQVGSDIIGEKAADQLGWAVDMNSAGDAVIVSAPWHDGNGVNAGYARIFRLLDSQWVQQGQNLEGRLGGDIFGYAVAISGNAEKAIISGPYNSDNGSYSGSVRAFVFNKSPTTQPTSTPSVSDYPTPSPFCPDSPLKILTSKDKGMKSARSCEFIAERRERFCKKPEMKTHCPYTCGSCETFRFSDSKGLFVFKGEVRDCKWLRESTAVIKASRLCQMDSIDKTCRKTCSLFVQKCE